MGLWGAQGRATWVLAGGVLAAALALGPHPIPELLAIPRAGTESGTAPEPSRAGPGQSAQSRDISREVQGTPENGVIFQKCALVSGQSRSQTIHVHLLVNNTKSPVSANLLDLLVLDDITGLTVRESVGNQTLGGVQTFTKEFLQVGDSYSVSYTASLDPEAFGTGKSLSLPAQLIFQTSSMNRTLLKAHFTITAEEKVTVLPNHGLHAAGFVASFVISFVLSWVALFLLVPGSVFTRHWVQHPESKLEPSPFTAVNGVSEDLSLSDQIIDILMSEDPGSKLQALEE